MPQQFKRRPARIEDENVEIHDYVPYADTPIEEVSLEELEELAEEYRRAAEAGSLIDTAHTDGSTSDPHEAQDQGLVYEPPLDPPVLPSDDFQNVRIAAGFASSMEEHGPNVADVPDRVDGNDEDILADVFTMLRNNGETSHLEDVKVAVRAGVVHLRGTVFSDDDIAIVDEMIRDMDGVVDVDNQLEVADEDTP